MRETKRSFTTLDGLRGIAALAVISGHAPAYFADVSLYAHFADTAKSPIPVGPFYENYLAVDFFFLLSGFVLAHAYEEKFRRGLTVGQFMTMRFVRLYPLYILALAIGALVGWRQLVHGEISHFGFAKSLAAGILFLPSPSLYGAVPLFPLNGPTWTLFFELLANLSFGLFGRKLSNIKLVVLVVLASLALTAAVTAGLFGFGAVGGAMNAGFNWLSVGAGYLRVTFSFFVGVLVYRVWRVRRPAANVSYFPVALLLIAILVAHPSEHYQAAFDLVVTIIIFPVLLWFGATSTATGSVACVFSWLGTASYAVYVLQVPLYNLTSRALEKISGNSTFNFCYGIGFVAFVFAVATIVDWYFDKPVRSILTRYLMQRSFSLGKINASN